MSLASGKPYQRGRIPKTFGMGHGAVLSSLSWKDVSKLPNITIELMKRGYSDPDIKKVLGENILRVMTEAERVARALQAEDKAH